MQSTVSAILSSNAAGGNPNSPTVKLPGTPGNPLQTGVCLEAAALSARVAELEHIAKTCDLFFWFLLQTDFADRHEARRVIEAMKPARRLLRPFEPMVSYSMTHGMSPVTDPALDALVAIATLDPIEDETAAMRAHRMQQIALDAVVRATGMELGGGHGIKAVVQNDWVQARIDAHDAMVDMWDDFDDIFAPIGTLPEPLQAMNESEAHLG